MKKIKVAFFADTLRENIDGAVRTMYQIIDRIPSDSFEFLFIVGEKPERDLGFRCIEVPSLTIPFNPDYKIAINTFVQSHIEAELKAFTPDVIHIASPSLLGLFAVQYAERHDIHAVSIYHTHFISYLDYYFRKIPVLIEPSRKLAIAHMQNFYNRCNTIYVPSQRMIDELSGLGIFRSKMKLWRRGLDNGLFSPRHHKPGFWNEKWPDNTFKILFASRLVWEKNLKTLVRIYKASQDGGRPYQFIIAGDGHARTELQALMPNALFMGELSQMELAGVYANSDVFLFPSVSETYGNVVVEAMASGLPCVIGDGGGTGDFVVDNVSGLVCSPFDVSAYLDAIERLRTDSRLASRLTHEALQYANGMSWDTLVKAYFEDISTSLALKYYVSA